MNDAVVTKKQIKEALYEIISEDDSYFREVITEVIEDIALGKAMEECKNDDFVDESVMMDLINSKL